MSAQAKEIDGVNRFEVARGSVVLVEPFHAIPLVSIVLTLRTGSASDPIGKEGLARLTMRMLRRGAEGLAATQIEDAIDRLGAEMAVDTSFSSVAIHAQVIRRNLDGFIDLLGRLLTSPSFPSDEFDRLKRESIAEIIEARDNDRVLAQKAFQRTLFAGHAYGRNPGGTVASLNAIEKSDVEAFYREQVTQRNIVVGFSGDISAEEAKRLSEVLVQKLPAAGNMGKGLGEPKPQVQNSLIFVDKPERTQTQILIGTLGTSPHDPDHVALGVANAVFGGTFTSRLMKEIRSKRGWSYGASSRLSVDRHRQAFTMVTFPAAEDAAKCIALEFELLNAWIKDGITPRETTFIQRYLTRSHAFDVDTAAKRLHQALDIEILSLPADYYSGYVSKVKATTAEAASDAVKKRIEPFRFLVVVVGTKKQIYKEVVDSIPYLSYGETVKFDAE